MGRLIDLVMLILVILIAAILQVVGGAMLHPMSDEIQESGISDKYDAEETFKDQIAVITKWAPLTMILGSIFLAAYREYRRQRVTAVRR